MLKIYLKLEDVPEGLREHYFLSDGRYVPMLSDDHPVLAHNKLLLGKNSEANVKVKELEADVEEAKKTSIPRGHLAVAKADAELLDKYKATGKTPDELTTALTEHKTLSDEVTKRQREDLNRSVAKELGFNTDAFALLPGLPEFEIRDGKDGKKAVVAKVVEGDKTIEKDAKEYIESTFRPLMSSLQVQSGFVPPGGGSGNGQTPDPYAWAKEFGESWNKSKPQTDVAAAFDRR